MNAMSFINSDLNKQPQALEVAFSRTTKSYLPQTCFNNILKIYLNEKLNFYYHDYFSEKYSNVYKIRKYGLPEYPHEKIN